MCGIVGFLNGDLHIQKYGDVVRDAFEDLLWVDTQRGRDGTGVVTINGGRDNLEALMYKNALAAPEYLEGYSYRRMIRPRLEYARAVIGHNRATTKGSVKNDNAHPFVHKHITLVHNGYIPNADNYVPQPFRHDVDSFAAAYNIAEKGELEGLQSVPFQGVLVWWNDQDKTLNMARNEHRTLYCVPIKGKDTLFYASEWRMLDWILDRNGLEPESKYKMLSPFQHFKFNPMRPKEWTRLPFVQPSNQNRSTAGSGVMGSASATAAAGTGQSKTASTSGSKEVEATQASSTFSFRADQVTDAELARIEKQFGRLSAKEKNRFGIPEIRTRLRKICAKIRNAGHDSYFGQRFIVYPDAYMPYKNQQRNGCISGTKRDTDIRVEIPNAKPEDFDRLKEDRFAFGTVVNAKKQKDGKWALVCAIIPLDTYQDNTSEMDDEDDKEELLPGPNGPISLAKFQAMTQAGCGNCNEWINPNHAKDMLWFAGEPICHVCATNEEVCTALGLTTKVAIH